MPRSSISIHLLSFPLLALSACGPTPSAREGTFTTDGADGYTYSFEYNGCKTGRHLADSRTGYCRNLANDELNDHCAQWMRKDAFDKGGCKDLGVAWDSTAGLDTDTSASE